MKLNELESEASNTDDDVDFDSDGEDEDAELEEDLCEAKELLEGFLALIEPLIRLPRGRKITYTQEKELLDICLETTAYLDQWEKA